MSSRFGYLNLGATQTDFFGQIEGVAPGAGVTITFPPFAPLGFAFAVAASIPGFMLDAAFGTEGEIGGGIFGRTMEGAERAGAFSAGVSDPTQELISDVSVELSLSWSGHSDLAHDGFLSYSSILLGVRLAGPRHRVPRAYVNGGWGYYVFEYDSPMRADARIGGPYVGFGFEVFDAARGPGVALGVEALAHFYFGDDNDGVPVDGGARQLSAHLAVYW